jgi:hypothetical protein
MKALCSQFGGFWARLGCVRLLAWGIYLGWQFGGFLRDFFDGFLWAGLGGSVDLVTSPSLNVWWIFLGLLPSLNASSM